MTETRDGRDIVERLRALSSSIGDEAADIIEVHRNSIDALIAGWNKERAELTRLRSQRVAVPEGWQDISTAPRDGTWFLALNCDREIWVARYDRDGRIMYRTNERYEPRRFEIRMVDGEKLLKEDDEYAEANTRWVSQWAFWSDLYKFAPTHWTPLPALPRTASPQPPTDTLSSERARVIEECAMVADQFAAVTEQLDGENSTTAAGIHNVAAAIRARAHGDSNDR